MNLSALHAPFDPDAISWRAQSVTKNEPYKAMALAYIDARDVMARLDEAVGPENWSDSYQEMASGRVICTISIRINDEWVSKADGSGDSDIEGEKGGISGAFKRAAVKWGIGRYLYDMQTPWAECEVYNGKWKKWTDVGLRTLARTARANSPQPAEAKPETKSQADIPPSVQTFIDGMKAAWVAGNLAEYWLQHHKSVGREHLPYITVIKDELKAKAA